MHKQEVDIIPFNEDSQHVFDNKCECNPEKYEDDERIERLHKHISK